MTKILKAPNGRRIVGTAEQMLVTHKIEVAGRNPDGSIDFEYTGDCTDHGETCEHRTDKKKRRLYTDSDGRDWPEDALTIVEVDDRGVELPAEAVAS